MRSYLFSTALAAALVVGGAASAQKAKPVARKPVAPAAKAAPKAALPAFTFKQAVAGDTMDPSLTGDCKPGENGTIECSGKDSKVAGIDLLLPPSYYFYNNRLTMMLFLFNNDGTTYLTFAGAFREKYGAPCKTSTEKWQSKAGAVFDNEQLTWCFKTGKLVLSQMSTSRDYGDVTYTDDYQGPTKATPKDF